MKNIFNFFLLSAIALTSCQTEEVEKVPTDPRGDGYTVGDVVELSDQQKANLVQSANEFAYNSFKLLAKEEQNYAYSPLSLYISLSAMAQGAQGNTLAEIENALGGSASELAAICKSEITYHDLQNSSDGELDEFTPEDWDRIPEFKLYLSDLHSVNSIWINKNLRSYDSFKNEAEKWLNCDVYTQDFSSSDSYRLLNSWIGSKTENLYDNLYSSSILNENNVVLVNGMFVDCKTSGIFEESPCADLQFHNADGSTSEVVSLKKEYRDRITFSETDNAIMASMETGSYRTKYAIDIIFPKNGNVDPRSMINQVEIKALIAGLTEKHIDLVMPRHTITSDYPQLAEMLKTAGINDLVDPAKCNLGRMLATGEPKIDIRQRQTLTFHKEGLVVPPAINSSIIHGIVDPSNPYKRPDDVQTLTIDRPFAYQLRNVQTGMVQAIAIVNNL